MANQAQRLIWLLTGLTAMAGGAPFSHRSHLQLRLPCVSCHAGATASTKVADNLLPNAAFCATCHKDEARAIKQPRETFVSQFSHQQHLKLGNAAKSIAAAIDQKNYLSDPGGIRHHLNSANACQACHRGLDESDQVSKQHFPQMADCLVCHNKIDPPFSCTTCHTEGSKLKPASHVEGFADGHSKPSLAKESCAVCHGRRFTCLGCH